MSTNKFLVFLSILIFTIQFSLFSQSIPSDLSKIKVDQLSDAQIEMLKKRMESSGISQEQFEVMAIQKGMSATELNKLKQRLNSLSSAAGERSQGQGFIRTSQKAYLTKKESSSKSKRSKGNKEEELTEEELEEERIRENLFGYDFFHSEELTFEISFNLPTPQNYILGPEDEVIIDVWGASEVNYQLVVSPEGNIFINNVGPIQVSGLTIEQASKKIKGRLKSIYSGLNVNTYAQVSLGNLRSIRVHVMGEADIPGTYTVPSVASLFNVLYAAGGPGINGSYRNIKIIRDNNVVDSVDLYQLLVKGNPVNNVYLHDQDIVFIPEYKKRIEVAGNVIRPGIYEAIDNETVKDLISFAGGFKENAYKERVLITRNGEKERTVVDLQTSEYQKEHVNNGDVIQVSEILAKFKNKVEIAGAVYREGIYELEEENMSLLQLINKADGLRPDAFLNRATIYRLNEKHKIEALSVSLEDIVSGKSAFILKNEDYIQVSSIFDLLEEQTVTIEGDVLNPETYPYQENLKLGELILLAGGLKESASYAKLEVARRVKDNNATTTSNIIAETFEFPISKNLELSDSASQFVLQPFDMVFVRRSPGYVEQKVVEVKGEVAFPGKYSMSNKQESVYDIIQRAGGLTKTAYTEGARLTRKYALSDEELRTMVLENLEQSSADTFQIDMEEAGVKQYIGVELNKIMQKPHSKFDMFLEDGDVLEIPKKLETVRLSGSVLYPVTIRYDKKKLTSSYIAGAGGFAPEAKKSKVYVLYANGSVDKTRNYLFFRDYPKIEPGAEIIVPQKPMRPPLTIQEIAGLSTMFVGMAYVVAQIIAL